MFWESRSFRCAKFMYDFLLRFIVLVASRKIQRLQQFDRTASQFDENAIFLVHFNYHFDSDGCSTSVRDDCLLLQMKMEL